jgi:hypothetical protein
VRVTILALLLLSGRAVLAQTPTPEPETVYSDAERDRDRSIAGETVQAVLDPVYGVDDQFARWKIPVCLNVYGLRPVAKYEIEQHIRDIAQRVGAPVDRRDPCMPNVTIIFTSDTAATLKSIHDVRDWLLPDYDFIRMRLKQSQPVQAWYGIVINGADGRDRLQYGDVDDLTQNPPIMYLSAGASILNTGISTAIATTVIVADTKAVMGKTLDTLADYFALLTLAPTRDTRHCKPVRSVANLMYPDCDAAWRADAITETDLALLRGLYRTPDNALQKLQRQRIMGAMRRSLEAGAKEK